MSDFKPHFAFSFSRYKSLKACPRRYWLETIGSWNGWRGNAPAQAQLLYRLSKMETLFSLSGKVVHSTIKAGLEDLRLDVEDAVEDAHARMRQAWTYSTQRAWAQPPGYGPHPAKTFANLAEHCYAGSWGAGSRFGAEDPKRTAIRAWERARAAIYRAWETDDFLEARESRILALEDLPMENNRPALVVEGWRECPVCRGEALDDAAWDATRSTGCSACGGAGGDPLRVPTWVRLDLAYESKPAGGRRACVIVDWKTGRPRPAADGAQVGLYGLFAHQVWAVPLEQISPRLVYLGSDPVQVVETKVTPELVAALRESIPVAAAEIQERLEDPAMNVGRVENFERTEDRSQCSTCTMFEGCYGHRDCANPKEVPA